MKQYSREIDGAQDFELGIPRTSRLTYHCAVPSFPAKGLVFVIPGFGLDADADYNQLVRRDLCARYGLVAVMVSYHACQARPPAAQLRINLDDVYRVIGFLATRKISVSFEEHREDKFLADLNAVGIPFTIGATLCPPNGDYQNFGVMQAIDHIYSLNDILDSGVEFDTNNILCVGSSHGAYIAHLIHKFAPNTINGIIDNSGYTIPLAQYIGARPEFQWLVAKVTLECKLATKWNFTDSYSQEYFGPGRYAIRDVRYGPHLRAIAAQTVRRCQFRMLNSSTDGISRREWKQEQLRVLKANGFDAELRMIQQSDLDGKILKSLMHGMDASIGGIFGLYADRLTVNPTQLDRKLGTCLTFECYDYIYRFEHRDAPPYFEASCRRMEAEPAAIPLSCPSVQSSG